MLVPLEKTAEEASNKAKEAKAEYRTLDNSIKKLDELAEKRHESAEAAEEYQQFNHHQKSPKKIIYELTKMLPGSRIMV